MRRTKTVKTKKSAVDKYISLLEHYARAHKIKVRYCKRVFNDSEGAWIPAQRTIIIQTGQESYDMVATLLHELGHFFDDNFRPDEDKDAIEDAYGKIRPRQRHIKIVYKVEEEAWNKGESIAKMLGIPLGKWFYENKKEALETYEI